LKINHSWGSSSKVSQGIAATATTVVAFLAAAFENGSAHAAVACEIA
jgi:hypothetical protein